MGRGSIRRRVSRLIQPAPRQEIDEELAFHLEERVREYVARGLDPEAARAAALERLGDLDGVRAECEELLASERRSEARRDWLKVSWLDFRLGFRMLVKYPGLAVVGGLAMAFAIWVGAGTFEFVRQIVDPALPLADGDRIVGIHVVDALESGVERRVSWDLLSWRESLESVEDLGAFRLLDRNLITGDERGEPVEVAEMSVTGFQVAGVAPLMGRTLVPADEAPGAAPVVVMGHDVWQRRFGGDPDIVGTTLRLGTLRPTVVGVMPEGFEFPVAQSLWMPLPTTALATEPRTGPGIRVFGRLAQGSSFEDAKAEIEALGRRAAIDHPETHEHMRPRVLPYARSILFIPSPFALGLTSINLFMVMLLVLICGNVALLMFARAATREGEILVRSALGASRARIIAQLFVEALVLGAVAAAVGLSAASFGLRWLLNSVGSELAGGRLPFWFSDRLSAGTLVYAIALTFLAAVVAGVLPALKVTGRGLESRLREVSAGGGGLRFGGVWTAVIVAQVALTVALPMIAYTVWRDMGQIEALDPGFAAGEYLSLRLEMDPEDASAVGGADMVDQLQEGPSARLLEDAAAPRPDPFRARFGRAVRELEQRLEARSEVRGVTFADRLPLMYHPHRLIEMDEGEAAPLRPEWSGYRVSNANVEPDYFRVLGVPLVAGRDFHPGDLGDDGRAVIVNESFVARVLGGRNALGRQLRYTYFEGESDVRDPEAEPWYEIVGVVPDVGTSVGTFDPKVSAIYHPRSAGATYPIHAAVHVPGGPRSLVSTLRVLATSVDPGLRLYNPTPIDQLKESEVRFLSFWLWILVLLCGVALLLSMASIYAAMSFAVSRRTREIGIRMALGANRGRIVATIFRRPLTQVGLGLMGGAVLVIIFTHLLQGSYMSLQSLAVVGAYMVLMTLVCALACIIPTRRALGVEPTVALRTE